MAGSTEFSGTLASLSAPKFAGNAGQTPPLAHFVSRTPASRHGVRYLTPKDLSRELAAAGIPTHEKTIRARCALPASDPQRIESHPGFPGRFYIPDGELSRLLNLESEASA